MSRVLPPQSAASLIPSSRMSFSYTETLLIFPGGLLKAPFCMSLNERPLGKSAPEDRDWVGFKFRAWFQFRAWYIARAQ